MVLLIEDNPADVCLVRKALEEHEVEGELTVLSDGEKALQFMEAVDAQPLECPDLVILDLNLPKKSGRQVLEFMRQSVNCRDMPVVILSSSDAENDRADASRLGATLYIRKPSRLGEFLNVGATLKQFLPTH
jgi:DNA-binding response OmpR family regulator